MRYKIPIKTVIIEGGGNHLLVDCKINKKEFILLIDTGASSSIFDINNDICKETDLEMVENSGTSSGFNSEIENLRVGNITSLKLNKFKIELENALFTSLNHINKIYKSVKLPQIAGILGCDFLIKHNAIIDLSKQILVLEKNKH